VGKLEGKWGELVDRMGPASWWLLPKWPIGARRDKTPKFFPSVHATSVPPTTNSFKIPLPEIAANRRLDRVSQRRLHSRSNVWR
jgi:hypothetical protein